MVEPSIGNEVSLNHQTAVGLYGWIVELSSDRRVEWRWKELVLQIDNIFQYWIVKWLTRRILECYLLVVSPSTFEWWCCGLVISSNVDWCIVKSQWLGWSVLFEGPGRRPPWSKMPWNIIWKLKINNHLLEVNNHVSWCLMVLMCE